MTVRAVAVPRRLEGVGDAGVPEAREELIAFAPSPVPLGLTLGIAPERLREAKGLEASLAGGTMEGTVTTEEKWSAGSDSYRCTRVQKFTASRATSSPDSYAGSTAYSSA